MNNEETKMEKKNNEIEINKKSNSKGITSMILGIISIIPMGIISVIVGIVGIVLSRVQRKEYPTKMATTGLILSVIGIIINTILIVLTVTLIIMSIKYSYY